MPLTGNLQISVIATLTKVLALQTASAPLGNSGVKTWALAVSAGVDFADKVFVEQRTLATGVSNELDLFGVLTDALGDTLNFARIKGIYVASASGNDANLLVGGSATNAFVGWVADATDRLIVRPNGGFLLFARDTTAYPVADGSTDKFKFEHDASTGNNLTYDTILIGE